MGCNTMTINQSISAQGEIARLRAMVDTLERTGQDPLKLRHFRLEIKFYEELEHDDETCRRNAAECETARLAWRKEARNDKRGV